MMLENNPPSKLHDNPSKGHVFICNFATSFLLRLRSAQVEEGQKNTLTYVTFYKGHILVNSQI